MDHSDESVSDDGFVSSLLSDVDRQWLDKHLATIRRLIILEAVRNARDRDSDTPEGLDVAEAARRFAPGKKYPVGTLWERTKTSLSGITLVSAVLAIVFGILGILVGRAHLTDAGTTSAYFDIAKLFAGAIVGSAGAGALRSARQD